MLLAPLLWSGARAQSTSDSMTYHGGPVIGASTTYTIFWLPSGAHFEASGDDTRYQSLIGRFLEDIPVILDITMY